MTQVLSADYADSFSMNIGVNLRNLRIDPVRGKDAIWRDSDFVRRFRRFPQILSLYKSA
jgi:hypothetical protein